MRYNLGYAEKFSTEAAGTVVENAPMYRAVFKEPVDPVRLEAAAENALRAFPLFATKMEFDREYYLSSNDAPLVILQSEMDERPKTFGKNTNGYPWRLIYDDKTVCFEWHHGVSDGIGSLAFFRQILLCYFGYEPVIPTDDSLLALGYETFYNPKEKGDGFTTDPAGFAGRHLPSRYRDYRTDRHCLHASTEEIVRVAHEMHSSVTPVLVILFCRAVRMHLPAKIKNRNVSCNFVFELRRILHHETMHNFVDLKRITYTDEYDALPFYEVARRYKETLDRARLAPNVIRSLTERIQLLRTYHLFPSRKWLKFGVSIVGGIFKNVDCNLGITYLGKVDLPADVSAHIDYFDLISWHDFGQAALAAIDYNGQFNLNLSENYVEKGIVEDFIKLSAQVGIHWQESSATVFEQAHFDA